MRLINKHAFCGFYQSIKKGVLVWVKYTTLFHFRSLQPFLFTTHPVEWAMFRNTNSKTVAAVDVVGYAL